MSSEPRTPRERRTKKALLTMTTLLALLGVAAFFLPCGCEEAPPAAGAGAGVIESADAVTGPGGAAAVSGERVELIVNLDDDRDDAERALEAKFGFDLTLNSVHADAANLFHVTVDAGAAEAILADLGDDDGVEYAEVNGTMEAFGFEPNDPLYMFQWHMDQIEVEEAWETARGDGVVVAVIDTGVAYEDGSRGRKRSQQMPDLAETGMAEGYDFVDNDDKPYDMHGHGTHVAGTIAQSTDNDYGVAGVAFNSRIMPLRVLDGQGRGNFSDVADAIRFAADHDADVINLSLGSFVPSREVERAIAHAHEKGVVVVAAAGNSGTRVRSYPAAFDHVIAVAATRYDAQTTFYSNYGSYIDVAAPGGDTTVDQNGDGKPDGVMQETLGRDARGNVDHDNPVFALYMGTSMAAPHVAGAAALLVGQGISNPDEVERVLTETASDHGGAGWDERYGHGIINARAAVEGAALERGLWQGAGASLLTLLAFFGLRRRDGLATPTAGARLSFWSGWTLGAGALFALPLLLGGGELLSGLVGRSITQWDTVLLGPGSQNPLFASALPALLGAGLLLGARRGRHFAAGLGLATGATLMVEAARHTVDVAWVPGVGLLDQAWLLGNGVLAATIGYLAWKQRA